MQCMRTLRARILCTAACCARTSESDSRARRCSRPRPPRMAMESRNGARAARFYYTYSTYLDTSSHLLPHQSLVPALFSHSLAHPQSLLRFCYTRTRLHHARPRPLQPHDRCWTLSFADMSRSLPHRLLSAYLFGLAWSPVCRSFCTIPLVYALVARIPRIQFPVSRLYSTSRATPSTASGSLQHSGATKRDLGRQLQHSAQPSALIPYGCRGGIPVFFHSPVVGPGELRSSGLQPVLRSPRSQTHITVGCRRASRCWWSRSRGVATRWRVRRALHCHGILLWGWNCCHEAVQQPQGAPPVLPLPLRCR